MHHTEPKPKIIIFLLYEEKKNCCTKTCESFVYDKDDDDDNNNNRNSIKQAKFRWWLFYSIELLPCGETRPARMASFETYFFFIFLYCCSYCRSACTAPTNSVDCVGMLNAIIEPRHGKSYVGKLCGARWLLRTQTHIKVPFVQRLNPSHTHITFTQISL